MNQSSNSSSLSQGELAPAAQEVRRRLLDAIGPPPQPRHDVASQDHDRSLPGKLSGSHRFDVRDHAREVARAVELFVTLRVEGGQIDADVAKAARLLEAPGALRTEVRGVGQDRDRQAAIEERAASLLEE